MSGAPTPNAALSSASRQPSVDSTTAASATGESSGTSRHSPATFSARSTASARVANALLGRPASSAALASSSADQRSLIPSPHTAGICTPNQPLARVSPSTPPSECPSTTTGRPAATAGASPATGSAATQAASPAAGLATSSAAGSATNQAASPAASSAAIEPQEYLGSRSDRPWP